MELPWDSGETADSRFYPEQDQETPVLDPRALPNDQNLGSGFSSRQLRPEVRVMEEAVLFPAIVSDDASPLFCLT